MKEVSKRDPSVTAKLHRLRAEDLNSIGEIMGANIFDPRRNSPAQVVYTPNTRMKKVRQILDRVELQETVEEDQEYPPVDLEKLEEEMKRRLAESEFPDSDNSVKQFGYAISLEDDQISVNSSVSIDGFMSNKLTPAKLNPEHFTPREKSASFAQKLAGIY